MLRHTTYFIIVLLISVLIGVGCNSHLKPNKDLILLFDAIERDDIASVKKLLNENKELINSKNEHLATPLHRAAYEGKTDILKYLISEGADVNPMVDYGATALSFASLY